MTIGQEIRTAREQAGMTQTDLAKAVGTTQAQIVRYEKDLQSPTINRVRDIARSLNIKLTDLLR